MLKKLNTLKLAKEVFINPSRKSSMRDLAKLTGLSVATISKECSILKKHNIIMTESVGRTVLVSADVSSDSYRFFKRLFNLYSLESLISDIRKENPSAAILYGSYSRGEDNEESDIDIAIIGAEFGSKVDSIGGRKIHIMNFPSEKKIPEDLRKNLNNGIVLTGGLL